MQRNRDLIIGVSLLVVGFIGLGLIGLIVLRSGPSAEAQVSPTNPPLPSVVGVTDEPTVIAAEPTVDAFLLNETEARQTQIAGFDERFSETSDIDPSCEVREVDLTTADAYVEVPFDAYVSMKPITSYTYDFIAFLTPNIEESVYFHRRVRLDDVVYEVTEVIPHALTSTHTPGRVSAGYHLVFVAFPTTIETVAGQDYIILSILPEDKRPGGVIELYLCP